MAGSDAQLLAWIAEAAALLHFRLGAVAEQIGGGTILAGERAVLRSLVECGPLTVPEIAAMRPVSRQYIQRLVDALKARGLVDIRRNPAHKRSNHVVATEKGRATLQALLKREASAWQTVAEEFRRRDLEAALHVMERLNELTLARLNSNEPREAVAP